MLAVSDMVKVTAGMLLSHYNNIIQCGSFNIQYEDRTVAVVDSDTNDLLLKCTITGYPTYNLFTLAGRAVLSVLTRGYDGSEIDTKMIENLKMSLVLLMLQSGRTYSEFFNIELDVDGDTWFIGYCHETGIVSIQDMHTVTVVDINHAAMYSDSRIDSILAIKKMCDILHTTGFTSFTILNKIGYCIMPIFEYAGVSCSLYTDSFIINNEVYQTSVTGVLNFCLSQQALALKVFSGLSGYLVSDDMSDTLAAILLGKKFVDELKVVDCGGCTAFACGELKALLYGDVIVLIDTKYDDFIAMLSMAETKDNIESKRESVVSCLTAKLSGVSNTSDVVKVVIDTVLKTCGTAAIDKLNAELTKEV